MTDAASMPAAAAQDHQDELGEGEKTDFDEVHKRIRDGCLPDAVAPVAAREMNG